MNERPTHIDLFSGIGGFALAAQWAGFRTVAFVEIDKYCQKVIAKNFMANAISQSDEGIYERGSREVGLGLEQDSLQTTERQQGSDRLSRIHSNIFDFDGTRYRGCDLLTGGFPCQPFSVAGKRGGAADDRAIWPQMFRVIGEAKPAWVLAENVPGIISMELDNVLSDLESIGYACWPLVIPACAVDARHRRDRLWIVGRDVADGSILDDAMLGRHITSQEQVWARWNSPEYASRWEPEPDVDRVVARLSTGMDGGRLNGASRVDRLKGLGNAIVPQVAYQILREIRKLI